MGRAGDGRLILAHLSDIHLPPMPAVPLRALDLKRALGWLNWMRLRRRQHSRDLLDRLVRDLASQPHDHVAVTGDIVNIALPAEFEEARAWLEALGPQDRVTVIPGNHELYAELPASEGLGRWAAHMTASPPREGGDGEPPTFPFVRRLGHVALVGLSSAVPTPPLKAYGRLGERQLVDLADILDGLGREQLARVVLIHHPPLPGQAPPSCGLADADALVRVLARHGAEAVLHGHNHRVMEAWTVGPRAPIPVLGAASASMRRPRGQQSLARYSVLSIADDPAVAIEIVERGMAAVDGAIVELDRRRLVPP